MRYFLLNNDKFYAIERVGSGNSSHKWSQGVNCEDAFIILLRNFILDSISILPNIDIL